MYIFDDSHIYLDPNELPKPKTTGFIRLLRSVTAGETWYESTLGCKIASVTNWKKHVDENPINQVPEEYQTARERLQQVTLRDIYLPLEKKQKGDPITKDHWVQEKAKIEKKLQRDLIENISKLAQQCKIIHTQTRLPVFKEAYDLFSQEKDLTKILETSTLLVKDLTATLMKFTRINAEDPSLPEEQKSTIKLASLAFKQFALYAFPQRYASPESPEEWEKIQQLQAPIRQYAEDVRTIFESYVFVIAP